MMDPKYDASESVKARLAQQNKLFSGMILFNEAQALADKDREQSTKAQVTLEDIRTRNMSKQQKMAQELAVLSANQAAAKKGGGGLSAEDYAQSEKEIRDRYTEKPKKERTHVYRDDAATKRLADLREEYAVMQSQLTANEKQGTYAQQLIKFDEQIKGLTGKRLTDEQKSLLAAKDTIRAELEKLAALEKQVKQHNDILKLRESAKKLAEGASAENDNIREQNSRELAAAGLGDTSRSRVAGLDKITDAENKAARKLADDAGSQVGTDEYNQELARVKAYYAERRAIAEQHYRDVDAMNADWRNGMSAGLATYMEEASNLAQSTKSLTTNALNKTQDALASFVTTGKLSFSDLATSIINDLAKIAAQQAMVGLLGSLGGMFGGGAAAGASYTTAFAKGGQVGSDRKYADGGRVRGPGTGTSDQIPIWVSNGEYIIPEKEVGPNLPVLEAIRKGHRYAAGGQVGGNSSNTGASVGTVNAVTPDGVTVNGGIHIHANSEDEGRDAMAGALAAMEQRIRAQVRQDTINDFSRPGGVFYRKMGN